MRLNEMKELRSKNAAEAREIGKKATTENRSLTDSERTRVQTLESENEKYSTRITDLERIEGMERHAPAAPVGATMPDLARSIEEFRTGAFLAHIAGLPGAPDVGRELEVVAEFQRRAGGNSEGYAVPLAAFLPQREKRALLYSGGSGSGAGLVFEQEAPDAIPALRAQVTAAQLGARVIDGLVGGPVSISKIVTGKTAAFIAEDSAGTPSDAVTDKVEMQPHHAIALTSQSRNMLLQTSASAQALINDDVMAAVYAAINRVSFAGGGANEPSGVWDALTPSALGTPTWAEILTMIEQVEIANAAGARLGFAAHPSTVRVLRSTPKLTFGSPVTESVGNFIQETARELADYPLASTTDIPVGGSPPSTAGLIFGDWSQLVIGVWESVNLAANPYSEAEFRRGGVAIRAIASVDVALRYEQAFQARTVATA